MKELLNSFLVVIISVVISFGITMGVYAIKGSAFDAGCAAILFTSWVGGCVCLWAVWSSIREVKENITEAISFSVLALMLPASVTLAALLS